MEGGRGDQVRRNAESEAGMRAKLEENEMRRSREAFARGTRRTSPSIRNSSNTFPTTDNAVLNIIFPPRAPLLPGGHPSSPKRARRLSLKPTDLQFPTSAPRCAAGLFLPRGTSPRHDHCLVLPTPRSLGRRRLFREWKRCRNWRAARVGFSKNPIASGSVFRRRRSHPRALFRRTPLPSHLVTS